MEFSPLRTARFSTFDLSVFVFSEKSRNGTERGKKVFPFGTETGKVFFCQYYRNSVFGQNFTGFFPDPVSKSDVSMGAT
jgi:hypothetical protein